MLVKHWGFVVLCMAMSFCSLISEKTREMTCLLLLLLPHIASCKTCDQLLKISKAWEGRNAGWSFAKVCGTKQRFTPPHMLSEYPWIQEHQTSGGFTSGMGTHSFCTAYVTTLEALQCQSLLYKSSGVQGTEQCVVKARWQSLLSN